MLAGLRRNTTNTQTFWGCDTTNTGGVLGVKIDGGSVISGDTLSSTNDYTGIVTATGLAAGTEYDWQLTIDDVDVPGASGVCKTIPATGPIKLLFLGDHAGASVGTDTLVARETADAAFLGEWVYLDEGQFEGTPINAEALATIRAELSGTAGYLPVGDGNYATYLARFLASYRAKQRATQNQAGAYWRRKFAQKFAARAMWGNHEAWTTTTSPWMLAPGTTQYDAALQAFWEYEANGNPLGTIADPDSMPNPVLYFSETIGNAEILVTDVVSYSDSNSSQLLDGSGQTAVLAGGRGEGKQLDWLLDRIDNTTAKFLIIYHGGRIPNNAEWTGAGGIFEHLNDRDISAVVLAPDIHRLYARYLSGAGIRLGTRGILEIGMSPVIHPSNSAETDFGANSQELYRNPTSFAVADLYLPGGINAHSYGGLRVTLHDDRMDLALFNIMTSATLWSGTLYEGERYPA